MNSAFFSSAQMILLECHESRAILCSHVQDTKYECANLVCIFNMPNLVIYVHHFWIQLEFAISFLAFAPSDPCVETMIQYWCNKSWTTLNISIREGETKFLYAMKLVSPKHLESIVHLGTLHYSLKVLALGMKVLVLAFDIIHWQAFGTH